MVAQSSQDTTRGSSSRPAHDWQVEFEAMLPAIGRYAAGAFAYLPPDGRAEAVQEVVAFALASYVRLVARNRTRAAYASVLARFAAARVYQGRRFAGASQRDVFSGRSQRARGFTLNRLEQFDRDRQCWREILIEDRRATPADVAASRLDFAAWLDSLSARRRQAAELLAAGLSTIEAAHALGVSAGRVSQLRGELHDHWQRFMGGQTPSDSEPN